MRRAHSVTRLVIGGAGVAIVAACASSPGVRQDSGSPDRSVAGVAIVDIGLATVFVRDTNPRGLLARAFGGCSETSSPGPPSLQLTPGTYDLTVCSVRPVGIQCSSCPKQWEVTEVRGRVEVVAGKHYELRVPRNRIVLLELPPGTPSAVAGSGVLISVFHSTIAVTAIDGATPPDPISINCADTSRPGCFQWRVRPGQHTIRAGVRTGSGATPESQLFTIPVTTVSGHEYAVGVVGARPFLYDAKARWCWRSDGNARC